MARMTQKKGDGRWQVKGIPWGQLREGAVLTEGTSQTLYGCLCKLKDYEDSGMDPWQLEEWKYALENMAAHVCDDICRFRKELDDPAELGAECSGCPVSACMGRILGAGQKEGK